MSKEKLDIVLGRTMSELLEKNVSERKRFMCNNGKLIKAVIPLLKSSVANGQQVDPCLRSLCIISELDGNDFHGDITDDDKDTRFWRFMSDFGNGGPNLSRLKLTLLINLTVDEDFCGGVCSCLEKADRNFVSSLVEYLGSSTIPTDLVTLAADLLTNVCRTEAVKNFYANDEVSLGRLLAIVFEIYTGTSCPQTKLKLISIVRNLCFKTELHMALLNPEFDLLVKLALPLSGSTELELDEEDMHKLPLDLQYLPPSKEREPCLDLRQSLVDCLLLLCATQLGRNSIRSANLYLILRELHKRESVQALQNQIENVVDIIIKDENEYKTIEDLTKLHIDEAHTEMFKRMDQQISS